MDPKIKPAPADPFDMHDDRPSPSEMAAGLSAITEAARALPATIDDTGGAIASALRLLRNATPAELRRAATEAAALNTPESAALLTGIAHIYETQNQPDPATIEDALAGIAEVGAAPTEYEAALADSGARDVPPVDAADETLADTIRDRPLCFSFPGQRLADMTPTELRTYAAYLRNYGFSEAANLIEGMADAAAEFGRDRPLCISFPGVLSPTQKKLVDTGADLIQTLLDKNADYGAGALRPPDLLPGFTAGAGLLIRIGDKYGRLKSLLSTDHVPAFSAETLADTVRDLAGYCILWLVAQENHEDTKGTKV